MQWKDYPIFDDEAYALLRGELESLFAELAATEADCELMAGRASRFPVAATVLLQLLRHNEQCLRDNRAEDALLAESLAYSTLQSGAEFRHWLATATPAAATGATGDSPLRMRREGNRLLLQFNRPDARNAYSVALRDALYEALQLLDADSTIERCVISGEGECFCVGGDLSEFGQAMDPAFAHVIRYARPVPVLLLKHAARIECRVHRACIGSGIELPAFAGRVVAAADTFFQLPELSLGLIPGAGGTVSILRRIGRPALAGWVLSGRKIRAETALAWGLVDAIGQVRRL